MSMVELTWPTATSMSSVFDRIRSWLGGEHMQLRGISSTRNGSDQLVVRLRFHSGVDAVRFRRGFRDATVARGERPEASLETNPFADH